LIVVLKWTRMQWVVWNAWRREKSLRKFVPSKAQGNHRLDDTGVKWMTIMQGMLDWIESALDVNLFDVVRRNFNGHINKDVNFKKRIDHLSNCQLSEVFDVPRFMRYNTMYSVNASIKKILHSECNCSVGFVLFNTFLLLFVFHKVTSINDPNISLKTWTVEFFQKTLHFLNRALWCNKNQKLHTFYTNDLI
jgi:hypothetical protein